MSKGNGASNCAHPPLGTILCKIHLIVKDYLLLGHTNDSFKSRFTQKFCKNISSPSFEPIMASSISGSMQYYATFWNRSCSSPLHPIENHQLTLTPPGLVRVYIPKVSNTRHNLYESGSREIPNSNLTRVNSYSNWSSPWLFSVSPNESHDRLV